MPSKNDLSALKQPDQKPILPSNDRAGDVDKASRPLTGKKAAGRKPSKNKRTRKVLLSLTESEGQRLDEIAGLAGGATVIYDHLLKTNFFD